MQQILDSARIAIQAIWANKLRSLLTLLGNIVAVSSIIAVVVLIQGVNGAVTAAIDDVSTTRSTSDAFVQARSTPSVPFTAGSTRSRCGSST